ncbi:serine dehydratase subunit alpha family protein [Treponema sp. OMZ 787]|uniref:L-cysteine desulfidase family protein n=1 Tax=Treponema sp. OMZ 787 TaxID=2563669 RepID=UPI0020A2F840|nr:L-serine ammonia-lyase, iron-sulfur-dependent, subunit alpha [Treponema sp. OMZ 787]UTC61877.1 serine dehydratase subunit alpha family protein [Treponema sp. OMZ 787]
MSLDNAKKEKYVQILKEELVPALGCTEPIAIAYTAANLRKIMGGIPDEILIESSGNIIKNAKSVIVPNTGGMKGMEASTLIGLIGGNADKGLEVLADVTEEHVKLAHEYLAKSCTKLKLMDTPASLHIRITGKLNGDTGVAELIHQHTNIVLLKKNDEIIFEKPFSLTSAAGALTDRSCLNVKDILEFADTVPIDEVAPIINRQIEYNMRVSEDGLKNSYGIETGKNILKYNQRKGDGFSIKVQAEGEVAAASDARMCGCSYPVITNSGSGNQGLAVSVPVVVYARENKISEEKLIRCLIVSNLLAIHQKTGIGRLSAYCGAVTAGAACAAAITYMKGGSYEQVCGTIANTLGTVSGILCDGAKQSCAAKIASALDSALFAHELAMDGNFFAGGDGVVKDDIEKTIAGIGVVAADGMHKTDEVVLQVMLKD